MPGTQTGSDGSFSEQCWFIWVSLLLNVQLPKCPAWLNDGSFLLYNNVFFRKKGIIVLYKTQGDLPQRLVDSHQWMMPEAGVPWALQHGVPGLHGA